MALDNPLPAPSQNLNMITNLNLKSKLATGSGWVAYDVILRMKILLVIVFLFCNLQSYAEVPRVTVHLLDHTDKQETKTKFWIDWSKKWRGIVSTEEASEEEAAKIVAKLRDSLTNFEAEHFCGHDPIYGIEALDSDGKCLKTSLCFTCLTWVKPKLRLSIAGSRGKDNELCKMLREVIELPEELHDEGRYQTTIKKDNKAEMATPRTPSDSF